MRSLLVLFLLAVCAPGVAQTELYLRMAEGICRCMEQPTETTARIQAMNCLTIEINLRREDLRAELGIGDGQRINREALLEELVDPLTENCPLLITLNQGPEEEKLRWSDNPLKTTGSRIVTAKQPAPDPVETTTAEAPRQWRLEGKLITLPRGEQLRVQTTDGGVTFLEIPSRLSRGRNFRMGEHLRLTYRREWRADAEGGEVVLVVTAVD